jgi:hypothetical protein
VVNLEEKKTSRMIRAPSELINRLERYRCHLSKESQHPIKFTEAARHFANTAITPKENFVDGISRIGKKWRWKV